MEPEFVSVIDCRGEKSYRENHTKWHELGHLSILTDECRSSFRRTHCFQPALKDPEESLVDVVASTFAFFPEMVQSHVDGPVSFERIEAIREILSPGASRQSALIGILKAWPTPCLLVRAELGLRKREEQELEQGSFSFQQPAEPVLRAVHVTQSKPAKENRFVIFNNMRVPESSVISRIFSEEVGETEAIEDLGQWESSGGACLPLVHTMPLTTR